MARETCPAMLMILRLVAFVDIALRCDRALGRSRKCGQSAAPSPGAGICTLCCTPKRTTARHQCVVGATAVLSYACSRSCVSSTTGKGSLRAEKFSLLSKTGQTYNAAC